LADLDGDGNLDWVEVLAGLHQSAVMPAQSKGSKSTML
jgi:hypothetical protein